MTFTLDTSGAIAYPWALEARSGPKLARHNTAWADLDPFVQGYVAALFASLSVGGSYVGSLQTSYGEIHRCAFSDLAPETLAAILRDCAGLSAIYGSTAASGALFWADRQRGSFEGLNPETRFPPLTVSLGDDGKVSLRSAIAKASPS